MKVITRIVSLVERISWLSPFAGGALSALSFWLSASRDPEYLGRGTYEGTEMLFRGVDAMAIKEVLVDKEYAFVLSCFETTKKPRVLDIGAHIGLFALWLLKQRPDVRIRSIEADPRTHALLSQNVILARMAGAQWENVNAAAWAQDGSILRFSSAGPSMSHRVSCEGDTIVKGVSLKSLLDSFVGESGVVDLLKVDIEGSEEAFLCSEPLLLRRVRNLVVELHPNLCDTGRVEKLLRESYGIVKEMHGRSSSKPLLLCY